MDTVHQQSTGERVDWESREAFEEFRRYIEEDVVVFDTIEEAYYFSRNAKKFLQSQPEISLRNPELAKGYERLIGLTSWVAVSRVPTSEVIALCGHSLVEALRNSLIDIHGKIVEHLITLPFEDRDGVKEQIRTSILQNTEWLTSEFLIDSLGKRIEPSVGNWIRDYYSNVGTGIHSALTIVEYFNGKPNPKRLPPEERGVVQKLFELNEKLKLSSMSGKGVEERMYVKLNGKQMILRNGKLEEVRQTKKLKDLYLAAQKIIHDTHIEMRADNLHDLQRRYQSVLSSLQNEKNALSALHGSYASEVALDIYESVSGQNLQRASAGLILLAERDTLLSALSYPNGFWMKYMLKLLQEEFPGEKGLAEDFQTQGFSPPYLTLLVRKLLSGMKEESAIIGAAIATALERSGHKGYAGMAYAELDWDQFVWGESLPIEGKLELLDADPPDGAIGLSEKNQDLKEKISYSWLKSLRKKAPPPPAPLPPAGELKPREAAGTRPPKSPPG